jgi:drug/metabolite transporter (DMT)-like permease
VAVAAALGWGASDYFGGDASRRHTPVFVIVGIAELLGVILLAPVLIARGAPPPVNARLLLAALAGVAVTVELSLIYRALGRGEAFITAPTGALGTAAAVTIGVVGGDPLGLAAGAGLGCALLGGGISAWRTPTVQRPEGGSAWQTGVTCVVAAAAIGTMLTCLHAAGRLEPYWATAIEHASTAVSAGLAALVLMRRSRTWALPGRRQIPALAIVAIVGVGGDLAYAAGSHRGALSIVAAISSLYPLATIALGRVLRRQRATRIQLVGIALALGGAALLGAATR